LRTRASTIARLDIGTGMTDGEVTDLSQRIDIPAAHAYRSSVGRRTRDVVAELPAAAWKDVVGQADIARAAAAGAFGPNAGWIERAWQGVNRASRLGATGISHPAMHPGDAIAIRGQLGLPVGM
jgi:hypothetical protein